MKNIACAHNNLLFKITMLFISMVFVANKPTTAQDKLPVKFGSVSLADFNLPKSSAIDSNTNAVIIADVGSTEFEGNRNNWYSYVYKKFIRIKVINKNAYKLASIKIPMYVEKNWEDKIDDLHASTYNIENGKVIETKLDNKDVFTDQLNKYVNEKKFTMPSIKEGSIIEYTYTITSFNYNNLPNWSFQHLNYPCLYSQFEISMPQMLHYLTLRNGLDSFYNTTTEQIYKNIRMNDLNVSSVIYNRKWIMKDIAAFKFEPYINNEKDYLDKIEFILAQTDNGRDVRNIAIDWKSAENKLLYTNRFAAAIGFENATNLYNIMKRNCLLDGDIMDAAKSIFKYVSVEFHHVVVGVPPPPSSCGGA